MTKFQQAVLNTTQAIPKGKVASYGQVAAIIGLPRAARQVGWILRALEEVEMPWWRVINNAGLITIKGNVHNTSEIQKDLLQNDGVQVTHDLKIDIEHYRWHPNKKLVSQLKLPNDYLEKAAQHTPFES